MLSPDIFLLCSLLLFNIEYLIIYKDWLSSVTVHDRNERNSFHHAKYLPEVVHHNIYLTEYTVISSNIWFTLDTGVWLLWMNLGGLHLPLMDLQLHGAAVNICYH